MPHAPSGWRTDDEAMFTNATPRDAATAVTASPQLPAGNDERFVGFGVMGLPFSSGHYLALRDFPATTFAPAYRSVWHRTPAGEWTFYASTPGPQSCARYFSATAEPVRCDIEVGWLTDWSLRISIPELLDWTVDMRTTPPAWLMSHIGARLPERAWTNRVCSASIGRLAGLMLRVGQARLSGTAPNGQRFMIAPTRVWAVAGSRAVLRGEDLGPVGPLSEQARLADFRPPQRGVFVVGHGHFENFDADRHRTAPDGAVLPDFLAVLKDSR